MSDPWLGEPLDFSARLRRKRERELEFERSRGLGDLGDCIIWRGVVAPIGAPTCPRCGAPDFVGCPRADCPEQLVGARPLFLSPQTTERE